jgi:hypothetical protein
MDAKSRDKAAEHHFERARATATGKEASRGIEETYSNPAQGAIEYNRKALAIAQANINLAFECAQELLDARSSSEVVEVMTKHARQQVQAMTEQTSELSMLAQKALTDSIRPLTTGLSSALHGAT